MHGMAEPTTADEVRARARAVLERRRRMFPVGAHPPVSAPVDARTLAAIATLKPVKAKGLDNAEDLRRLVDIVADVMAVDPEMLRDTRRRGAGLVAARKVYCFAARYFIGASYPQIGRAMNYSDHTTALYQVHGCREAAEEYRIAVSRVKDRIDAVLQRLGVVE